MKSHRPSANKSSPHLETRRRKPSDPSPSNHPRPSNKRRLVRGSLPPRRSSHHRGTHPRSSLRCSQRKFHLRRSKPRAASRRYPEGRCTSLGLLGPGSGRGCRRLHFSAGRSTFLFSRFDFVENLAADSRKARRCSVHVSQADYRVARCSINRSGLVEVWGNEGGRPVRRRAARIGRTSVLHRSTTGRIQTPRRRVRPRCDHRRSDFDGPSLCPRKPVEGPSPRRSRRCPR